MNLPKRGCERQQVALPARITWKDAHGATRFASVVTRDVSELVCSSSASRLSASRVPVGAVPAGARSPRIGPDPVDTSQRPFSRRSIASAQRRPRQAAGLALRLMVDPKRQPVERSKPLARRPSQAAFFPVPRQPAPVQIETSCNLRVRRLRSCAGAAPANSP